MAKRKSPREPCVFCESQPCTCSVVRREKALRAHQPGGSSLDKTDISVHVEHTSFPCEHEVSPSTPVSPELTALINSGALDDFNDSGWE